MATRGGSVVSPPHVSPIRFECSWGSAGKPVTTCVVDWVAADVAKAMKGSANSKWPKGLKLVYDAVTSAILEGGVEHRVSGDGPVVRAVSVRDARNVPVQRYVSTGDGDPREAEKKAWQRNFREARNTGLIGGETVGGQELIWMAAFIRKETNDDGRTGCFHMGWGH